MNYPKQLDLLKEIENRHPDGVIEAEGNQNTSVIIVIELGRQDFNSVEMLSLLKEYWHPQKEDSLYIINFEGIDVLTPSAARILIESVPEIASEFKVPFVFSNVHPMVMECLESEASRCDPPKIIWVIDEQNKAHLVGKIANKLKELLTLLEEQKTGNASSLALLTDSTDSKKAVGNLSVYLQKLFNAGLVGREKVNALERDNAERGWTYNYSTAPSIYRNAQPKTYLRKP